MDMSTVSPPPPSPTEGDNPCETDVTSVAIHSGTLLICLWGLAGNRAVLCLLSLESRNSGIFDLALADFLFLLFMVPLALLFSGEDLFCSPIVPSIYVSFLFQLSMVSYVWTLFRLMLRSDERDMYNLCKLCCCSQFPLRLWLVMWRAQLWVFFALLTVILVLTFLCSSHKQGHCRAALISMYAVILLLFAAPVVISCTIDIIKVKHGSHQQQLKRRHIVIFIILLFTLLLGLCNFLQQLGYISVSSQVVFRLTCIHSNIKPFIYFLAGKCWRPCSMGSLRLSLQRVFEEKKEITAHNNDANTDTVI